MKHPTTRRHFLQVALTTAITGPLVLQAAFAQNAGLSDTHVGPLSMPDLSNNIPGAQTIWLPKEADNILRFPVRDRDGNPRTSHFWFPNDRGEFELPEGTRIYSANNNRLEIPNGTKLTTPRYTIQSRENEDRRIRMQFDAIHILPEVDRLQNARGRTNLRSGLVYLDTYSLSRDVRGRTYLSVSHAAAYDDRNDQQVTDQQRNRLEAAYDNFDVPGRDTNTGRLNMAQWEMDFVTDHMQDSHGVHRWMYQGGYSVADIIAITQTPQNPFITKQEYEVVFDEIRNRYRAWRQDNPNATRDQSAVALDHIKIVIRQEAIEADARTTGYNPAP